MPLALEITVAVIYWLAVAWFFACALTGDWRWPWSGRGPRGGACP